jgi:hypothetical protein
MKTKKRKSIMLLASLVCTMVSLFLILDGYSQECSRIIKYNGPKNTEELRQTLNNTDAPAIKNLNEETKNSLIKYMVFREGHPIGMSDADENIQELYKSTEAVDVFSSILGNEVTLCSFETKPPVENISIEQYNKLIKNGAVVSMRSSTCWNCLPPPPEEPCCLANGKGCIDNRIVINNHDYHVITTQLDMNGSLSVFPNPSNGLFNIKFQTENVDNYIVTLSNSLGQVVCTELLNKFNGIYSRQLDILSYGKGLYMLKVTNSKNEIIQTTVAY